MALTLTELHEKLKQIDEISLMEVLEISSEDLVGRFQDRIQERYEDLVSDFPEDSGLNDLWDGCDNEDEL